MSRRVARAGADTAGTYLPLIDGESNIIVPADTAFVPLIVANRAPVAVSRPLFERADPDGSRSPPRKDTTDVVAWVKLDRSALSPPRSVADLPQILLTIGETEIKPPLPALHGDPEHAHFSHLQRRTAGTRSHRGWREDVARLSAGNLCRAGRRHRRTSAASPRACSEFSSCCGMSPSMLSGAGECTATRWAAAANHRHSLAMHHRA